MKSHFFLLPLIILFSCNKSSSITETNNSTTKKNPIYLDANGVTVKAYDWAPVGDKGVINNIEYTIVSPTILFDLVLYNGDISKVCTSKLTSLDGLFSDNRPIKYSIQSWDVSNVKTMRNTFSGATNFLFADLSKWDVRNVTDMSNMFDYSKFNGDISNWNISNVTDMTDMFSGSTFNRDISKWNVSNVIRMARLFKNADLFNSNISQWNVSNVTDMSGMFTNSNFNGDFFI